MQISRAEITPT